MVPVRGIEPRVDPYHGSVLPLYYTGICRYSDRKYSTLSRSYCFSSLSFSIVAFD